MSMARFQDYCSSENTQHVNRLSKFYFNLLLLSKRIQIMQNNNYIDQLSVIVKLFCQLGGEVCRTQSSGPEHKKCTTTRLGFELLVAN